MNKKFFVNTYIGEDIAIVATNSLETALDMLVDAATTGHQVDMVDMETGEVLAYQTIDGERYVSDELMQNVLVGLV